MASGLLLQIEEELVDDQELTLEIDDHLAILTLNRPESRNPLGHIGDGVRFRKASARINQNKDIRCVILTGKGKAFSAGGDIKSIRDKKGHFAGTALELREHYRENVHGLVQALWDIEVPLIGAINGPAIGLGNDVACLCDIRIASDSAKFGATFLKLGLIPGDGGAWLLPKIIGWSRASELFFTGEMIDASKALEWGLVSEVVATEDLDATVGNLARRICAQPPNSLRMTKQLMRDALESDFRALMNHSASLQSILHHTEDHDEAVDSFFKKTNARFEGR
jgi:enoyl-CoA hydratase/carnithine racemase